MLSKRIIGFLVKRSFGKLFKNELLLDQLELQSEEILLHDLEINDEYVNEALADLGSPYVLLAGFVGQATAKIPWKSLVEPGSNMTLSVSNVDLVLVPGNPANFTRDKEKHAESVDENSSSLLRSIYDLEWSMNQPVGHIPEVSESRPITNAAGVEMLGQLINKLIYKLELSVENVDVHLVYTTSPGDIIPSVKEYSSITASLKKLDLVDSKHEDGKVESPRAGNLKPDVLAKRVSFSGLRLSLEDLPEDMFQGKGDDATLACLSGLDWERAFDHCRNKHFILESCGSRREYDLENWLEMRFVLDATRTPGPNVDIKGSMEALRAALSPTQLEILLKYFHFGQSSVISALVRDEEKNEGDVKDASQLEQSILPEDEAIIKEMIGELEKQTDVGDNEFFDADDGESSDDDMEFFDAEDAPIDASGDLSTSDGKIAPDVIQFRADLRLEHLSLCLIYDETDDTASAFEVSHPTIDKTPAQSAPESGHPSIEEEVQTEDEDDEEDDPGSGWLGVEPVPAAASHHAIFQISAIQLRAEHSSMKSSAEMNCDSLCALEYLRIKQEDDNDQLRRDEEGEAADTKREFMESSASWHNLNYYGFKQSFATRGDEAEYLKNHLMIFRSRDKFVRRHLTCTLTRQCLQPGSNLYDRFININVPEVYLEVDPEILHRLEGFLSTFDRVSRESLERIQGVMVDVEEDGDQEENDFKMTESGSCYDDDEQLSGKLHFTLGGGFLCVKLRFAGQGDGHVRKARPESVLFNFFYPKISTVIFDRDSDSFLRYLVEFDQLTVSLLRNYQSNPKIFFEANLRNTQDEKTTPLEITLRKNESLSSFPGVTSSPSSLPRHENNKRRNLYDSLHVPKPAAHGSSSDPQGPFSASYYASFEGTSRGPVVAGEEQTMAFRHQAKESSRYVVSLIFPSSRIQFDKEDYDLLVDMMNGLSKTLSTVRAPTEPENPRNEKTEDSTDHSSLLSFVVIFLEGALVLREDEPERAIEINRGDSAAIPSFLGQWHNHSFELEYQRLEIFQVLRYWGQDHAVVCLSADSVRLTDSAEDSGTHVVLHKPDFSPANQSLSVIFEATTADMVCVLALRGLVIEHSPGYDWALRLAEFFTPPSPPKICDTAVQPNRKSATHPNDSFSSPPIRCFLKLNDLDVNYRPIHVPSRSVCHLNRCEISTVLSSNNATLSFTLDLHDASAWMIDNIGFSRHDYWRSESESIDLQSHWRKAGYANIASVDFIQIQVDITRGLSVTNGEKTPLFQATVRNNSINVDLCRDSASSFQALVKDWIDAEMSAAIVRDEQRRSRSRNRACQKQSLSSSGEVTLAQKKQSTVGIGVGPLMEEEEEDDRVPEMQDLSNLLSLDEVEPILHGEDESNPTSKTREDEEPVNDHDNGDDDPPPPAYQERDPALEDNAVETADNPKSTSDELNDSISSTASFELSTVDEIPVETFETTKEEIKHTPPQQRQGEVKGIKRWVEPESPEQDFDGANLDEWTLIQDDFVNRTGRREVAPKVKWVVDDDSVNSLADALNSAFSMDEGSNNHMPQGERRREEGQEEQDAGRVYIIEDYENVKIASVVACPESYPQSLLRFIVDKMNINMTLHDGLDYPPTRRSSRQEAGIRMALSAVTAQFDVFTIVEEIETENNTKNRGNEDGLSRSCRLGVAIESVDIYDELLTSTWHKFMCYDVDHPRPDGAVQFRLVVECLRPKSVLNVNQTRSSAQQYTVNLRILPLRFYVDQDAFAFLQSFLGHMSDDQQPSARPSSSSSSSSAPMVFRKVDISTIMLQMDYKPKRVNLKNLVENPQSQYVQLVNLVPLEGAMINLPATSICNVGGFLNLAEQLKLQWFPQVDPSLAMGLFKGLQPLKPLVDVGSGVADLFLLPIEQYRKDGRLFMGLQRGTWSFLRSVSRQTLSVTNKLVSGTQVLLEWADFWATGVSGSGDDAPARRTGGDPDQQISRYASQPENTREGVQLAMESILRELKSTGNTIIAMPVEEYQRSTSGALVKVIRAVPVAVIRPIIGITEGVSKTLQGMYNDIEPIHKQQADDKYKAIKRP